MIDVTGKVASNVIGAVIGAVGGSYLSNWLPNLLGLKGWGRNIFVWDLSEKR